jgi:hypothetical protein
MGNEEGADAAIPKSRRSLLARRETDETRLRAEENYIHEKEQRASAARAAQ